MSDLNKMAEDVQKDSKDVNRRLKSLMTKYEELLSKGNRQFVEERAALGSMAGLDEFYMFVQTIKRNRDVIGSLMRGLNNLRPLSNFKVIEEDIPDIKPAKSRKKTQASIIRVPEPVGAING